MSNKLTIEANTETSAGFKQKALYGNEGIPDDEFLVYEAAALALVSLVLDALSFEFTEYAIDSSPPPGALVARVKALKSKVATAVI